MLLPFADVNLVPENVPIDGFIFGVEGAAVNGIIPVREQGANGFFSRDYDNAVFESGRVYYFQVSHPDLKPDIELVRVRWDDDGLLRVLTPQEDPDRPESGGSGSNTLGGLPVLIGNTQNGQIISITMLPNGSPVITNTPAPTLDSVILAGPGSDRSFRHGPSQQRQQPLVADIQRIRVSFFSGVENIWNHAEITFQRLLQIIRGEISLSDVLSVRNTSENTAVLGGLGLFRRNSVSTATRLLGLVPALINGAPADYCEPVEFSDILLSGAAAMSPAQKSQFANAIGLNAVTPFSGTVTGVRCIDVAGPDAAPTSYVFGLADATDGQIINNPFDTDELLFSYYALVEPKRYRLTALHSIRSVTVDNITLEIDPETSPFTGRLEIKPATPTA